MKTNEQRQANYRAAFKPASNKRKTSRKTKLAILAVIIIPTAYMTKESANVDLDEFEKINSVNTEYSIQKTEDMPDDIAQDETYLFGSDSLVQSNNIQLDSADEKGTGDLYIQNQEIAGVYTLQNQQPQTDSLVSVSPKSEKESLKRLAREKKKAQRREERQAKKDARKLLKSLN